MSDELEDNLRAAEVVLGDGPMRILDEVSDPKVGYPYQFIKQIQGRW